MDYLSRRLRLEARTTNMQTRFLRRVEEVQLRGSFEEWWTIFDR